MSAEAMLWRLVAVVSAAAVAGVTFGDAPPEVRAPLVLWFVGVCPGMALVGLIEIENRWARVSIAVALSFALATIVPTVLVYAHAWSPRIALLILIGVTVVASAGSALLAAHRGSRSAV